MKVFNSCLAAAYAVLSASTSCLAQSTLPMPRDNAWATQEWTGSDGPYKKIRRDISAEARAGKSLEALRVKYKKLAQASQRDPLAQFRWGYVVLNTFDLRLPQAQVRKNLKGLDEALAYAPFPKTYEYARVMFIVRRANGRGYNLIDVGERLLRRAPRDNVIKYYLVSPLSASISPADEKRAVLYANQLIAAKPKQASYYSVLGSAYTQFWLKRWNPADADKAIAAYQKYLQVAPPDAPWRPNAREAIQRLQESKVRMRGKQRR